MELEETLIAPNIEKVRVAGRKRSGKIFAFHGFDTYQFDQQNKISFLKVKLEK